MKSLQLEKPHAIVMVGIKGSGKTFFASKFAETFHAPFIEEKRLRQLAASEEATKELIDISIEQATRASQSIVLELETDTKTKRLELAKHLAKLGYTPLFVWVQVDADTAATRAVKQDGISVQDYTKLLNRFHAPSEAEKASVISGKHTYATQARIVLKRLSAPRAEAAESPLRQRPSRGQIIIR